MPPKPRAGARTDYRHFPDAYFKLCEAIRVAPLPFTLPFRSRNAALTSRRDIYRFRGFLRDASDTGDEYASDLHSLLNSVSLNIVENDGQVAVEVARNAVDEAIDELSKTLDNLLAAP